MNDRIKVRCARASDASAIGEFARRRVEWLGSRDIKVDWAGSIRYQAEKVAGENWRAFVAAVDDVPVGRVVAWIEPPTDPANGDRTPRRGTLGLTGLCTDPRETRAAAVLADWSARYADVLGLAVVRLPTVEPRLRDHYQSLGFTLGGEATTVRGKTVWELFRAAE